MAVQSIDNEDPYLELLDVEANEIDDKELEDLMTPEEKIKQKMEAEAKQRQRQKVKRESSDLVSNGNEEEKDEVEENEEDGKTYVTLFETRLKNATEWKNKGNVAFKEGNFKTAMKNYQGALIFLKGIENDTLAGDAWASGGNKSPHELKKEMERGSHPTPENLKDWKNMKVDLYNNIITCMFREKQSIESESEEDESRRYNKMLKYCDEILELDPVNAKALFKRGKINFCLHKYDEAYELFRKAEFHIAGQQPDKQLSEYIRKCEKLISKHYKEMMGMFKGVFDKMATEEEIERQRLAAAAITPPDGHQDELERIGLTETKPRVRDVPYNIIYDECDDK